MDFSENLTNVQQHHPKCNYLACASVCGCAYGLKQCEIVNGPYSKVPALSRVEEALGAGVLLQCYAECGGHITTYTNNHFACQVCGKTYTAQEVCRMSRI